MGKKFVEEYFGSFESKWTELNIVVNLKVDMMCSNKRSTNLIVRDSISSDAVAIWNQVIPNEFITIFASQSSVALVVRKKESFFQRLFPRR